MKEKNYAHCTEIDRATCARSGRRDRGGNAGAHTEATLQTLPRNKSFNDNHLHPMGDHVLHLVARSVTHAVKT